MDLIDPTSGRHSWIYKAHGETVVKRPVPRYGSSTVDSSPVVVAAAVVICYQNVMANCRWRCVGNTDFTVSISWRFVSVSCAPKIASFRTIVRAPRVCQFFVYFIYMYICTYLRTKVKEYWGQLPFWISSVCFFFFWYANKFFLLRIVSNVRFIV